MIHVIRNGVVGNIILKERKTQGGPMSECYKVVEKFRDVMVSTEGGPACAGVEHDHYEIEVQHDPEEVKVLVYDDVFYTINKEGQVIKHKHRQKVVIGYFYETRCKRCGVVIMKGG